MFEVESSHTKHLRMLLGENTQHLEFHEAEDLRDPERAKEDAGGKERQSWSSGAYGGDGPTKTRWGELSVRRLETEERALPVLKMDQGLWENVSGESLRW